MKRGDARLGEFELIAKLFAPLAHEMPGAFGLTDDVALLKPPPGHQLVLKTDSLIESVHFLQSDPAETVGRKALRRALSDLAAKGAQPLCYLLALALPDWPENSWLEAFAAGLAADQRLFGISLAGGETNATPGPLALTVTALGLVPEGTLIRRNGSHAGDCVFVTGTIGDAAGGLALATGSETAANNNVNEYLLSRYHIPQPRLAFGGALRSFANASIDVSDGLLADLGHIADASGVRIEIDASLIPMSDALRELWGSGQGALLRAAAAGDDYEIAFTAPASLLATVREALGRAGVPVTAIGCVVSGSGVALMDATGREIAAPRKGYMHF